MLVIFHYFIKGYEPELAYRELFENRLSRYCPREGTQTKNLNGDDDLDDEEMK